MSKSLTILFRLISNSKFIKLYFTLTIFASKYLFSLLLVVMRIWIADIFWKSGLTKIISWNNTVDLFKYEYKVPVLSPEIAAFLATSIELSAPIFIIIGLFSRIFAGLILILIGVIEFTYMDMKEHYYWAFLSFCIVFYGPGIYSVDHYLYKNIIENKF